MSNSNENDKEQAHDDALKALHGMGGSDDSEAAGDGTEEVHEKEEAEDKGVPSPAASGFVGMLAKEGKEGGLDAREGSGAGIKTPAAGGSGNPLKAKTDQIFMAREIKPVGSAAVAAENERVAAGGGAVKRSTRVVKGAPGWYHAAVPVMYTLGSILLLIGFWSVGALLFMAMWKPTEEGTMWYPLLTWNADIGEAGAFTSGSRAMAWVMLACLPVSFALGVMAGVMQRHIRATQEKKEKVKA